MLQSCFGTGVMVDPFTLQSTEEAFGKSIVVAVVSCCRAYHAYWSVFGNQVMHIDCLGPYSLLNHRDGDLRSTAICMAFMASWWVISDSRDQPTISRLNKSIKKRGAMLSVLDTEWVTALFSWSSHVAGTMPMELSGGWRPLRVASKDGAMHSDPHLCLYGVRWPARPLKIADPIGDLWSAWGRRAPSWLFLRVTRYR